MSSIVIVLAALALPALLSAGVMAARRGGPGEIDAGPTAAAPRSPIIIRLPPGARMRLVREQGLSYALEVDDTVRITGIGVSQMAKVAASLANAHRASAGSERQPPS
jgi:hypothetical protein